MHFAAFSGHIEIVLVLLALAEDSSDLLSATDAYGFRPLEWAVLNGHAPTANLLCAADKHAASSAACEVPLTPLQLAAAAGDVEVLEALLAGGAESDAGVLVSARELAEALGHADCANALSAHAALEQHQPVPPAPSTSPASSTSSSSEAAPVRRVHASELARDRTAWDEALRDSVPLLVEGLAQEWADGVSAWGFDELRRRWGTHEVAVAFAPDERYQRIGRDNDGALCLFEPSIARMPFAEFVDALDAAAAGGARANGARAEHCAVQQSQSDALAALDGLGGHALPPLAQTLLGTPPAASNLWVCQPPKLSRLHYDCDDSLLLQLKGSKTFTLIDPTPLGGLTAYPTRRLPAVPMERTGLGAYRTRATAADARATRSNFPLLGAARL